MSYTRFRLGPKSSTLDDLERPWTANTHHVAEKMRLLEHTAQIWINIDPCCERQKCRSMTCAHSRGFLLAGASNESGVGDDCQFLHATWVATSSETSETRPAIFYGDLLTLVGHVIDCKMNDHNDLEWLFRVKPGFSTSSFRRRGFNICVNSDKHRPILSAAKILGLCL